MRTKFFKGFQASPFYDTVFAQFRHRPAIGDRSRSNRNLLSASSPSKQTRRWFVGGDLRDGGVADGFSSLKRCNGHWRIRKDADGSRRGLDVTIQRFNDATMILRARQFEFAFPRPAIVMGIVNVTPDSLFDGGRFFDWEVAVARALELAEQGAEIIDIGGESTRPGAQSRPLSPVQKY